MKKFWGAMAPLCQQKGPLMSTIHFSFQISSKIYSFSNLMILIFVLDDVQSLNEKRCKRAQKLIRKVI